MNVCDISDINSEAGVVATVILHPSFVFYSEQLTPHHFTNQTNAYMYHAICELAKMDVDKVDAYNITNVLARLKSTQTKDIVSNLLTIPAINELIDNAPYIARGTTEEYKMIVDNVLNAAFRRDVYNMLVECQQLCFNSNETEIEQRIYASLDDVMMEHSAATDIPQYKDVIDSLWEDIKNRQNGELGAIQFPFPKLNEYVVMEPGELVCFTGAAKSGKSAILLTCTVDLLKKGKGVLYIDSEISSKLFSIRLLSHLTGIRFADIRSGNYSEEDGKRIEEAVAWLKTRRLIHLYLPIFDESAVYLAAKKAKHMIDIECIVVDYLKSTGDSDEAFSVYAEMGRFSDTLKNKICGDMQLCGLTAAQATSSGRIADSARIARSVSTVISITDKTQAEIEDEGIDCGTKKMRVVFNRNGPQMSEGEWIDMAFNGSVIKYEQALVQHALIEPF